MKRPRKAVRIGVPILIVGLLALVALWRIGAPPDAQRIDGQGAQRAPLEPLTNLTDIGAATSILRKASLENVRVRALPSERTAWIDAGSAPLTADTLEQVFAVLDPDVKRPADLTWQPGSRVTLIGIVRPAPESAEARRLWHIDETTSAELARRGTYLHVTEIRMPGNP